MPRSAKFRVPDSYVHGVNLVNGNVTWEFKKNKLYSYHITILILKQRKARPPIPVLNLVASTCKFTI
eukprot:SAG31_NODE_57_length_29727_cov_12.584568_8_plen_67_part_00